MPDTTPVTPAPAPEATTPVETTPVETTTVTSSPTTSPLKISKVVPGPKATPPVTPPTIPVPTPAAPQPVRSYGWKPQLPDKRDLKFTVVKQPTLPSKVDMRPQDTPIYDQGELGSCVSNAVAAAFEFERKKLGDTQWNPSRLYIYYNGRVIENTVPYDDGLYVRDGIKSVVKKGACNESLWPYDITQFAVQPPSNCYAVAATKEVTSYMSLNNSAINTLKQCLYSGYPFIFGFTVYTSFESTHTATTGMVTMPNLRTEQVLGGHCMMVVGFDDSKLCFIVRNSWGAGWGLNGYCYFPYNYMTDQDLAGDFWTVRMVSGN